MINFLFLLASSPSHLRLHVASFSLLPLPSVAFTHTHSLFFNTIKPLPYTYYSSSNNNNNINNNNSSSTKVSLLKQGWVFGKGKGKIMEMAKEGKTNIFMSILISILFP